MKQDYVLLTLNMLYDDQIDSDYCSPNFVASYIESKGFALDSGEIVMISDLYGTENCPTGRNDELNNREY